MTLEIFPICDVQTPHLTDWAQVIIAIVNLFFVVYIFTYQRQKDRKDDRENLLLQDQTIKLQWFKELIILPNLSKIYSFYSNIRAIAQELLNQCSDEIKINIADRIKKEQAQLRKSFVELLRTPDPQMESEVKKNLDKLVDKITVSIFDTKLNLSDPTIFDQEIANEITYSENNLINTIYTFKPKSE